MTDNACAVMDRAPLTEEEMNSWRKKAKSVLAELEAEVDGSAGEGIPSWLRSDEQDGERSKKQLYLDMNGFVIMRGFCSLDEVQSQKDEMKSMVEDQWDPAVVQKFATDPKSNTSQGDYFLDSADRTHFFAEPDTLNDEGDLKQEYRHGEQKIAALNKVGHGMHAKEGNAFHSYTTSSKMKQLVCNELGWKDPVCPQSMYIFKQAKVGGVVHSHQDSTFLWTSPRQSCLGLWLALDDATLENGCLWVRPKSHVEGVRRRLERNQEYFGAKAISQRSNQPDGNLSSAKLVFTYPNEGTSAKVAAPWEGKLPASLDAAGFIPVECQAGDLLVFVGTLDHLSLANTSEKSRHTFQLHMVEGPRAGVSWAESNWLQYPEGTEFLRIG